MRRHTVIDLHEDGPRVRSDDVDQSITRIYTAEELAALGATPGAQAPEADTEPNPVEADPNFKAGAAAGLGAFFDACISKGMGLAEVTELLWIAYDNLRGRRS